ncbi:two component transcriptional regulator, LytTR family [Mariniphaga anaerophila]|uniref:Two component transcriptional regulator, LytTR family n=1 Tax=Mariniphaga anaerophila TaxID=1484053 RepID=A0A1M4YHR8_9BACT|nr:LytTR family DNA-binding domain-containing protein [Mariniphaga anaerophila]SHF05198.1 two component transcriptional regulator, LytTR family [Mariniphaga anaerophila]
MSQSVKIVLVEDELYNLRLLEGMIKKLRPEWEVINTFESVKKSVEWLRQNPHPDLFFMDVQLADGLCFSIFDKVEINSMVIFTTAYDNYAIRAFKVNSIDYLLKPFKGKDLEAAIEKFENIVSLSTKADKSLDYSEILEAIRKGEKKYRKRFLVTKGALFFKLPVEEVACFYSENRITTAYTFNRKKHIIDFSLEALEEQLDPDVFFRANRQAVVNIKAVDKIENYFGGKLKIRMHPPFEGDLVVSRLKASDFKAWVGK